MITVNGTELKFKSFPNGEVTIDPESEKFVKLFNGSCTILFKYEEDGDLIKLMFVKKYFDSLDIKSHLYISYMPYSRMDRTENLSPFTLKYVTEFINGLNFEGVAVVEPHSDVTMALLNKSHSEDISLQILPYVENEIAFDKKHDYLFFPDAGAQKRYGNVKGYQQLVGFKKRNFQTGEIEGLEIIGSKDPAPSIKKIIIIDDLSSYGGTFLHSGNKLREMGFKEIYLIVAHAENAILHGKLFEEDSPITKVFTTDTILTDYQGAEHFENKNQLKLFKMKEVLKWEN